ncbi:GNAT family N-acetyltransferase [Streptococcus panodentis]|uniref:N-acetyltransferase n=1 Tax=Streptococcus panodentis TaxID=1581472 RepID=A0ABS5AWK3_9STRE|nr:GNAT family N-acetyltransferase [Streptococcus panodentis]MBP2620962.1 N-acetyltransferase [Streptococcus panodentis]
MIELKLVDKSSFQAVLDLKISEADERARFVAPNVRSLADAWLYRENGDVFPTAIYWDGEVIGFVLLEMDKEESEYFIWRIMIGQQYQGRGYGRKALEALIEQAKADVACDHLVADYVQGNDKMKQLLTSLGFEETGWIEEYKEVAMRLDLKKEEKND